MKKFRDFLTESSDKNTHLEHLEDEVFNGGVAGTRRAINFLRGLRDMLHGSAKSSVNVTVKWDGAPAIVCGINPENGKFFVATKSAFNKNPKLNYTAADINKNHSGKDGLIEKLKIALKHFPKLGIKGVLQGDLLFTNSDLKTIEHDGESLLSFKANTITYAIPENSNLAQQMKASSVGVVFHTTYTGKKIEDMKASFGADVSKLNKVSSVWVTDSDFKDESGTATLTADETAYVSERLSEIGQQVNKMNSATVSQIVSDEQLRLMIKTYVNSKVKTGENIQGTKKYAKGLVQFITDKYQAEIDKLKTDKGKNSRRQRLKEVLRFIKTNEQQFVLMFLIAALIADVKGVLLSKLRKVNSIGTFLETPDGFKVTSPEGFVAIDKLQGGAVKLVDRLEFSKANFTLNKDW